MDKVVAALLLLAISVSAGDPEVAEFLLAKGQKEARAKNYEEAENLLRRSIAEYPPNPEASFAHGQVLEKLDRAQEAAVAYKACIDAVDGADSPSTKWKSASRRSARALSKLKKQFAALEKINRKYLPKFVAFGKKHYKTNPRWSRRAFEAVLAIDPTNSSAKAYLAKLPAESEMTPGEQPPKGKAWGKALIDRDHMKNWEPGESDTWSIKRGVITGDTSGRSGHINWINEPTLHGNYALQFKFRVVRDGSDRRTIGVIIGDGKGDWWSMMIDSDNELLFVRYQDGKNNSVKSESLDEDIKMSDWHTMRIEVDNKDSIEIFVDDKAVIEMEIPKRQKFVGQMAFFVQEVKAQFKDLELRK